MKGELRRYVGFKLSMGKLWPDPLGDVTLRIERRDLVALQGAWGFFLKSWSAAHGPRSDVAGLARAMSGTLYNLATSRQRGAVVDVRIHWRKARILGKISARLVADCVKFNNKELEQAARRAIDALCSAGAAATLGRPVKTTTVELEAIAAQPYRSGDSAHNSRVSRAKKRLRDNQNSA